MKKIFALLMVCVLVTILSFGCGTKKRTRATIYCMNDDNGNFIVYAFKDKKHDTRTLEDTTFEIFNGKTAKTYAEEVVIPSEIGGDEVKGILNTAFEGCDEIESITIPSTITIIDKGTFAGCSKDLVIKGEEGSEAEHFAKNNGFEFEEIDDWLNIKEI